MAEAFAVSRAAEQCGRHVQVCQQHRYGVLADRAREALAGRPVALVHSWLYRQKPDIRGNDVGGDRIFVISEKQCELFHKPGVRLIENDKQLVLRVWLPRANRRTRPTSRKPCPPTLTGNRRQGLFLYVR
jgi:hypothetical protein